MFGVREEVRRDLDGAGGQYAPEVGRQLRLDPRRVHVAMVEILDGSRLEI
jgi:hypothetical protein